jgi:hypothetical protein
MSVNALSYKPFSYKKGHIPKKKECDLVRIGQYFNSTILVAVNA